MCADREGGHSTQSVTMGSRVLRARLCLRSKRGNLRRPFKATSFRRLLHIWQPAKLLESDNKRGIVWAPSAVDSWEMSLAVSVSYLGLPDLLYDD
jgi:hypothetical protein